MPHDAESDVSKRVLVLAPTGRDAEVTADILGRAGFVCAICANVDELIAAILEGAGIALLTAEALTPRRMKQLGQILSDQPAWSELPLVILVAGPEMARAVRSFEGLGPRAHFTLVDRPIHVKTLVSTARAALRSRLRQYEVRDLLGELQERVKERDKLIASERDHANRLAGLTQASLSIASALSLDDVLQLITNEARKVLDARMAVTSLAIDQQGLRKIRSVTATPTSGERSTLLSSTAEEVLESQITLLDRTLRFTDDVIRDHPLGPMFGERLRGSLLAPLLERDGQTVGVIALAGKDDGTFTEEDETVLTPLAQMASAAVQNARLYREAQEANRAKDDFLATLAHELRTPMTGILGWVQMLKMEGEQQEDVAAAIQMIESSTRVQARLVEDLLDVSRIIAGKLRVEKTTVELGPVVETVVETFRTRAEEGGVTLELSIDPTPLSVYGDETRLHQVIWNLLSNAIKFTPPGGKVVLELKHGGSQALISVRDSGEGIAPEFLPFVFERFRQADNTTTRPQAGLGLGLAIVRHLVELHSGTVTVESEGPGHGATFTVRLPILAVRTSTEELPRLHGDDVPQLTGLKILVVDDDSEAARLIVHVLTELGASVVAASSVGEAIRLLRRFTADVIVSDIAMPGEDGYALMRRLREIEPHLNHEVRTVALTGYGRPEDRRRILSSGFERYIQKPVDPVELAHAIAAVVKA